MLIIFISCFISKDDLLPVPHLKQKSRGMIEYSPEDEEKLIRTLIIDMNPASVADDIPGLPAHILFMCIRHADHMNDDRRLQSLLSSSINSIRKVVKVNLVVLVCQCIFFSVCFTLMDDEGR